jgi:DNA-binding SARP family transcriptional activator
MAWLSLTVLGDFQARLGSGSALRLRTRHTQALLAYLALPCGMAHSRDQLAALLWGHLAQDEARTRLRQALFTLRRALAPAQSSLSVGGDTVVLEPAGVEVDALVFEELVKDGSPDALERAATLYGGDLLQGLPAQGPQPSAFEEWLAAERERLRELAIEALAKLSRAQRMAGARERALVTTLRLLSLDPLQEAAHRTVMRLHVELGRRTAGLQQYQACVNVLRRELHVEPEEETRQLYRDILRRRRILAATAPSSRPAAGGPSGTASLADEVALVGREEEVAQLRALLAAMSSGSGQTAFLIGETGAGKSRLVATLVAEAHAAGADGRAKPIRVLLGRCHDGEQILPFGPWTDAIRAARLADDAELLAMLEPVWRAELVRLLPEFGASDIPASSDPPDAPRLFEGVRRVFGCLVTRSPLVFILEDLHWADEMSLRLLQFLARRVAEWPLLLVGTVREDELPDLPLLRQTVDSLAGAPHVERLSVAPLSRRDTLRLVRALSGPTREPAALDRLGEPVWRASGGNPFVVIETMRSLRQGVALVGPGELPLAEHVQQVTARRLDRLSGAARELTAVGAVVGRAFGFDLLRRAAARDEATTAAGVEELVRRQVLHEVAGGLDFVHERVRATISAGLVGPRRRLLHRRVAEAIDALHVRDLDPHLLALGIHYREGEVWDKAAAFFARAGFKAFGRAANVESVTCFEHALDAVNRLPESDDALRQGIDVRIALRHPLSQLGRIERFGALLEEAERMASRLNDRRRDALVAIGRCHYLGSTGHAERACAVGQRAVASARGLGDRELESQATLYTSLSLLALGRHRAAAEPIPGIVDFLEREPQDGRPGRWSSGHALACSLLARCLAQIGAFPEAIAFGERGLARAEQLGNPFQVAAMRLGLGAAYLRKGDLPSAIAQLGRGLALVEAHDLDIWLPATSACLGLARARSGEVIEGLALLDRALRCSRITNISIGRARWMTYRGEANLLAGQLGEARQWAEAGLRESLDNGERAHEAQALLLLGDVSAREGPAGLMQAEARCEEALALAVALEMRPLAALCHLSLGVMLQQENRAEAADQHLSLAVEMLRQMDMKLWLHSAEAHLSQLREPVARPQPDPHSRHRGNVR